MICSTKKPLIGLAPGYAGPDRERKFAQAGCINFVDLNYTECVEAGQGLPVVIPYVRDTGLLKTYVEMMDGLLLVGGVDLHPRRYGQELLPSEYPPSEPRDAFDLTFLKLFLESRKPVFAICRGIQVLNVLCGGSLIQDIPSQLGSLHHFQTPGSREIAHTVRLEEGSRLARLVGSTTMDVNSFHHQCIDRLGDGLTATAHSEEGVIEAVELNDYPCLIAVQWHPERMSRGKTQIKLFSDFVRECREGSLVAES